MGIREKTGRTRVKRKGDEDKRGGVVESDNSKSTGLLKAGVSKTERESERKRERDRDNIHQLLRKGFMGQQMGRRRFRIVQNNCTDVSVTAYILSVSDGIG